MIATASRLMALPIAIVRAIDRTRLFETHQTADNRGRAGFGSTIDHEDYSPQSQTCRICTARLQCSAGLGKVIELMPRERPGYEVYIVPFALNIEPFNEQLSVAFGLENWGETVKRKLWRHRRLIFYAAKACCSAFADFLIDRLRMACVAFYLGCPYLARLDHALLCANDHRPDAQ